MKTRLSPRAFTIIELLLALLLTSLLTAALSMMIGQAARDRRAMLRPDDQPAWMVAVIDQLERDLQAARWWAGTNERLVLIGLGRDGNPAHIEYRWQAQDTQSAWLRHETPLTTAAGINPHSTPSVLALDPLGITIGPYTYGQPVSGVDRSESANTKDSGAAENSGAVSKVSVVVEGRSIPLLSLPDQVEVSIQSPFSGDATRVVSRKVVLR